VQVPPWAGRSGAAPASLRASGYARGIRCGVLMLQTPSCSMIVIGTAPDATRYPRVARCPQGHRAVFRLRNAHLSGLAEYGF
jgi:hypothetical protein